MSTRTALIGATGLVGGTLLRHSEFDDLYHSRNIEEISGRAYASIVCAGAPAVKWKANKDPDADLANLVRLMSALEGAEAGKVVLISTVDVYPEPRDVDETTLVDVPEHHAYGKHRRMLERFVSSHFKTLIVRLPGLFGKGLKKNIIYDLLHGNQVDQVDTRGVFQFYDLEHLWSDLQRAQELGLDLVNFATEPVSVEAVAREGFGLEFTNHTDRGPARYDMRSIHAEAMGGRDGYLMHQAEVLGAIRAFVDSEGWERP